MNDRELLEMAAKSVAIEVWTDIDGNFYTGDPERAWNPLASYEDSIGIAGKLYMNIEKDIRTETWGVSCFYSRTLFSCDHEDLRIAIVHLAAEVGKKL